MTSSFTMTLIKGIVTSIGSILSTKMKCLEKGNEDFEEQEWTNLHRWRLYAEKGRHTWKYLETDEELYWLGLTHEEAQDHQQNEPSSNYCQSDENQLSLKALGKGSSFLRQLQMEDGSWGSNCDGPMFITSGIVFACYVVGIPIPRPLRLEMSRYLPEHPTCKKARDLLTAMGGVLGIPTWGRFWLCVLNLYDWDGIVPLLSEILLTPPSFQLNPANWWMPIRNIYMAPEDDLIRAIRQEIYGQKSYNEIQDWSTLRPYISTIDLVKPKSMVQSAVVSTLSLLEWLGSFSVFSGLRTRGLNEALFQVEADVHTTEYCAYAPAYWAVDIIALSHARGRESHWVQCMAPHFADGLWMLQAICSSIQLSDDNRPTSADLDALDAAPEFIRDSQLLHDPIEMHRTNRHLTKGGWPYSTHMQGYIVSDSRGIPSLSQRISIEHLQLAVDSLIGMESGGSGFAAYEKVHCMIERRYAETTGAVLMALTQFNAENPNYRSDAIRRCIDGGAAYLLRSQYHRGGWIGTWGVCFSFATMWALQGLACAFLLRYQNCDNGGWGEALQSYGAKDFVAEPEGSQVPNAQCSNLAAIERGVCYLTKTQQPNGEWLPGTLEGIYTPPCGYRYPLYKFHFTLKALAGYTRRYGNKSLSS
ncbi:squalene-hopene-cyclase [Xylaria venustula]|nr:squalene-hopene-cyclase [Xylaria venustula]